MHGRVDTWMGWVGRKRGDRLGGRGVLTVCCVNRFEVMKCFYASHRTMVYLVDILNGDISISNNNQLCLENTIRWDDILSGEGAQVHIQIANTDYRRTCTCATACLRPRRNLTVLSTVSD